MCCLQVACLSDADAHLALDPQDSYVVQTKPHGHGDVHSLLHASGLLAAWHTSGVQWVAFFQDTNGLVFRALPAALGEQCLLGLMGKVGRAEARGGREHWPGWHTASRR